MSYNYGDCRQSSSSTIRLCIILCLFASFWCTVQHDPLGPGIVVGDRGCALCDTSSWVTLYCDIILRYHIILSSHCVGVGLGGLGPFSHVGLLSLIVWSRRHIQCCRYSFAHQHRIYIDKQLRSNNGEEQHSNGQQLFLILVNNNVLLVNNYVLFLNNYVLYLEVWFKQTLRIDFATCAGIQVV